MLPNRDLIQGSSTGFVELALELFGDLHPEDMVCFVAFFPGHMDLLGGVVEGRFAVHFDQAVGGPFDFMLCQAACLGMVDVEVTHVGFLPLVRSGCHLRASSRPAPPGLPKCDRRQPSCRWRHREPANDHFVRQNRYKNASSFLLKGF